nr:hypothetical protein Iba_chr01dCG2960 [Ipomoea batatas]
MNFEISIGSAILGCRSIEPLRRHTSTEHRRVANRISGRFSSVVRTGDEYERKNPGPIGGVNSLRGKRLLIPRRPEEAKRRIPRIPTGGSSGEFSAVAIAGGGMPREAVQGATGSPGTWHVEKLHRAGVRGVGSEAIPVERESLKERGCFFGKRHSGALLVGAARATPAGDKPEEGEDDLVHTSLNAPSYTTCGLNTRPAMRGSNRKSHALGELNAPSPSHPFSSGDFARNCILTPSHNDWKVVLVICRSAITRSFFNPLNPRIVVAGALAEGLSSGSDWSEKSVSDTEPYTTPKQDESINVDRTSELDSPFLVHVHRLLVGNGAKKEERDGFLSLLDSEPPVGGSPTGWPEIGSSRKNNVGVIITQLFGLRIPPSHYNTVQWMVRKKGEQALLEIAQCDELFPGESLVQVQMAKAGARERIRKKFYLTILHDSLHWLGRYAQFVELPLCTGVVAFRVVS